VPVDYELIKSQITIGEILSKYGIRVPQHGHYRVPCPLHHGRNANFAVNEAKRVFYCFKCGAAGSVIDLVAGMERVSPTEAATQLAGGLGNCEFNYSKASIRRTQQDVRRWREFTSATVDTIGIPFDLRDLPAGYRNLGKKTIDHYRLAMCDRGVFIPHFDITGRTVGYSIRQPDGVLPKYLNNPGFPKGIPYGLYQNKGEIIKRGFAVVCEGQIDSISLWERGYGNAIALMGSSMTDQQAHLLLSLTTKLMLLFDGDRAGRAGASKTFKRWQKVFDIDIELLPNGVDPADYMAQEVAVCV
jgi:DNA primase